MALAAGLAWMYMSVWDLYIGGIRLLHRIDRLMILADEVVVGKTRLHVYQMAGFLNLL